MEDYPRNLSELEARFSSEAACREYLFQLRWPDGFRCPRCVGAKSCPLRSVLLGCYKTAWTWLHKLRRAMVRAGRDRLTGSVEVDETYVGGLEEGMRGRQTETKTLVVIAAQEDGAGIGRIR